MIDLINVINVSVSLAPTGMGNYNVNNLALFTSEAFLSNPNNDVYRVYVSAEAVATDFGSSSEAYKQAVAVFSQQPNILAGGGSLIIFPLVDGTEALGTAITRTKDLIFYCGIISTAYGASTGWKTLADQVQAYGDKILFLPTNTYADVAGAFTDIKAASDYKTRCLLHNKSALDARLFAAAYASRLMSVIFQGSNTAMTMNLKSLATIDPDTAIDQTKYTACATAGVDIYIAYAGSDGGIPSVVSNGANRFADSVFNLIWFVSQLKVNGFNALRQISTKIPQTEPGMSILKGAYRRACEQAFTNGFIAPGSWTSAETFGVQDDFLKAIAQRGYYIYSQPVTQQSAADRNARKASTVQIAIKEAGAMHSTIVNVNVNS